MRLHCVIYVFIILCISDVCAQEKTKSLIDIIAEIEDKSDYVFNYSNEEIFDQEVDQEPDFNNLKSSIQEIFHSTKFDITIQDHQVFLLPPAKKQFIFQGQLLNELDEPLSWANITVNKEAIFYTDDDGRFDFDITVYKNEIITFSYLGYIDLATMAQDLNHNMTIKLKINEHLIKEEIIIKDYVSPAIQEGSAYNGILINQNKMRSDPLQIDHDPLGTIQNLPGVSSPDETVSNLNIRGSTFDHNLILWEGIPLYDQGHMFGMISSINPFALQEMTLHKSIYNAEIENRIGGVVDLRMNDQLYPKCSGTAGSSFTDHFIAMNIPIKKDQLTWQLAGRSSSNWLLGNTPTSNSYNTKIFRTYRGIQENETLEEEEEENEDEEIEFDIQFFDINSKIIYKPTDHIQLSSALFIAENQFNYNGNLANSVSSKQLDTLYTRHLAMANKININFDAKQTLELTQNLSIYESYYQFEHIDSQNNSDFSRKLTNNITDQQIKIKYNTNLNKWTIDAGYVYDIKDVDYFINQQSNFIARLEDRSESKINFHHLFTNVSAKASRLRYDLGFRLSKSGNRKQLFFSPRVNLRYSISNQIIARIYGGIFQQFVRQFHEYTGSNLSLINTAWYLDLQDQNDILRSKKIGSGISFQNRGWLIDLELYHHNISGIETYNPFIINSTNLFDQGQSLTEGMDIMIQKQFNQFQSSINYSLSSVELGFLSIEEDEQETEYTPANNDQTHILSWINSYQYKRLNILFNINYKTGLPFTDRNNLSLVEEQDDDENEIYEFNYENINGSRLKDYIRYDLSLQYKSKIKKYPFEFNVSCLNLLNRINILSRSYIIAETDNTNTAPELIAIEKYNLGRTLQCSFRFSW